jgi:hypothetical protein
MTELTPSDDARAERYALLLKAGQAPDAAQALVDLIDRLCTELERLKAQRAALAARLRAGQTWQRGRTPALVKEDYISQGELRQMFGIPLTAPWEPDNLQPTAEVATLAFNILLSALQDTKPHTEAEARHLVAGSLFIHALELAEGKVAAFKPALTDVHTTGEVLARFENAQAVEIRRLRAQLAEGRYNEPEATPEGQGL